MNLDDQKKLARQEAFARRKVACDNNAGGASGKLSEFLAGFRGVPTAGFMPINTEIDPRPAMAEMTAYGPVGVPVIQAPATPLKFAEWTPECVMVEGAFKAQIPADLTWIRPEIVIVPLVAFDRAGGRLGYGGGFYDRTLEGLRAKGPVLAVGFAFAAQEAANLPLEATDQPLDMMITEKEIFQIK